jgi:hypothetical protein
VSIDYTRRGPKPAPRRTPPVPAPAPTPASAPTRPLFSIGYAAGRTALFLAGVVAMTHQAPGVGVALVILAGVCWWRMRRAARYLLAVAGMSLIRWWVVRKTRPYAHLLEAPGRVTDPNAPWRQWLDTRCGECGV